MDRYFIVTGPIVTEWTFDEIKALVRGGALALHEIVESPSGEWHSFYYRTKVVTP